MDESTRAVGEGVERWLSVDGFPGYEVSDHGRVRSLDRLDSIGRRRAGRVFKPQVDGSGHHQVTLCVDGKEHRRLVHRLVLEAFVGECPPNMEGCHNDGDPANNALANLRWDTRKENVLDRTRHGTQHNLNKTHCPRGHEYAGDNLIIRPGVGRGCRACARDRYAVSR